MGFVADALNSFVPGGLPFGGGVPGNPSGAVGQLPQAANGFMGGGNGQTVGDFARGGAGVPDLSPYTGPQSAAAMPYNPNIPGSGQFFGPGGDPNFGKPGYQPGILPDLGQYTRDPSTATHVRQNEFPAGPQQPTTPAAPVVPDPNATHAPIIQDPLRPWHEAMWTGGFGTGPLGQHFGIPHAPAGMATWVSSPQALPPPVTALPAAASGPLPLPTAPTPPVAAAPPPPATWGAQPTTAPNNADTAWHPQAAAPAPMPNYGNRQNEFPGAQPSFMQWGQRPQSSGAPAWGDAQPSWRR